MNCDCYWYTDIGGRAENEDSVGIAQYEDNLVAVVADGLGGQGDGKAASESVRTSLLQCGADGAFPDETALEDAFRSANESLMAKQKNAFHMKSTAVYLCIQNDRAVWAHIGDSRLYHVYEGKLRAYTLDHSSSQLAAYLGQIRREDIPRDPGRNRLLKVMGVEGDTPEIHEPIQMEAGRHAFLLCSDGLWEYLSDESIEAALARAQTAREAMDALREERAAVCPADCDNNSAIVILMKVQV